ncbi:hypothetical protein [Deinococcus ruber]|uniref:hypothetical protein n=1 Tax=Deinococcus ruber TaxID=1848197 RepID=UPI001664F25C|nr:hypothetical protein [Deinococcus ruber]
MLLLQILLVEFGAGCLLALSVLAICLRAHWQDQRDSQRKKDWPTTNITPI